MNWVPSWGPSGWQPDGWQPSAEDAGVSITNASATQPTANSYNVCQRSGKRYKPGELIQEWTGLWVHSDYLDHRSQQDFVRVHAEKLEGSIRPEAIDNFITTSVTAESL